MDYQSAGLYVLLVVLLWLPNWSVAPQLQLGWDQARWLSLVLLVAAAISTLWRKQRPGLVLLVAGLGATAALLLSGELAALFLHFEAILCAVLYGSRALARFTTVLCLMLTTAVGLLAVSVPALQDFWLALVLQTAVVLILPLLWGWEVRHHRQARTEAEKAAATQRQLAVREQELAQARTALQVQEQRRRIAQNLHDGVAGHLSAVALQTAVLRTDGMRTADPETRDKVLDSIRTASVDALAEMHRLIDVLRDDHGLDGEHQQLDHQQSWSTLRARLHASFPEAQVTTVQDAARLLDGVSPDVAEAVVRIAQESVTNILKHAAPGDVQVRLQQEQDTVVFTADSAYGAGSQLPGAQLGVQSMALRAQETNGRFHAGLDTTGSRWRVEATWPVTASAVTPTYQEAVA